MFKILQQIARTGIVTSTYPNTPADLPETFRGKPVFDFAAWQDARPAAAVCPTGAISIVDSNDSRRVVVDYGLCIFCGLCVSDPPGDAVRMTQKFELAVRERGHLMVSVDYELYPDGTHRKLSVISREDPIESVGRDARDAIWKAFGRSLAIRQVDAGSCNGCELEIAALNNPVYDIERFGIQFVASPRHADMLLVTGPVTKNMELALLKTFRATPEPKLVVAVGTCGISGGIFGESYASLGGVENVLPVDVFIPGCPPRPQALLHGIMLAIERPAKKR
jgi:Ni,Fe-hydrogenase III small subunit/formate hydrogenlyase subunit 6/NADH:ubiquinone oxidoreductase subunit I